MITLFIWFICFCISWWLLETLLNITNSYTGYDNWEWKSCWEEEEIKPWVVPIAMLLVFITAPLAVILLSIIYLVER